MECRVCAEDPDNQFFPSAGKIDQLREPSGPGVRLDSGIYPGWKVPLEYDSLLAKLVACGPDRDTTIQRLDRALNEYAITGVETNIAFFKEILRDPEFLAGNLSTEFVADFLARRKPPEQSPKVDLAIAMAALAHLQNRPKRSTGDSKIDASRWLTEGRGQLLR
jgi:acetyl-CoA carboxylase biotin carboxylase subunit